jgi:antitoxin MazE
LRARHEFCAAVERKLVVFNKGTDKVLDNIESLLYLLCRNNGVWNMRVQVQKWGNSLAIRIPKSLALDTKIEHGTFVHLTSTRGKLVATPIADQEYSLKELLDGISEENIHGEVKTGKAVGKEIW